MQMAQIDRIAKCRRVQRYDANFPSVPASVSPAAELGYTSGCYEMSRVPYGAANCSAGRNRD
jgi:hypothetical protein